MKLIIDNREGVHNEDIKISNADSKAALSWLKKLDGKRHTLLNLDKVDGTRLTVGGGSLWYIVTLDDSNQSLTLQNPDGLEAEMIELCAGGQYAEFSQIFCADQKQTAQAILLFFEGSESQMMWI